MCVLLLHHTEHGKPTEVSISGKLRLVLLGVVKSPPGATPTDPASMNTSPTLGKASWGFISYPRGNASGMMRTDAPAETRTATKASTGSVSTAMELTGAGTIWTDIAMAISVGTVFPTATTGGRLRCRVRPPRVSMGRESAWSVGGSARAAGGTPPEPCVQKRPWAWQVRSRCFCDEDDAVPVSIICGWIFSLENRSPDRVRGVVEVQGPVPTTKCYMNLLSGRKERLSS